MTVLTGFCSVGHCELCPAYTPEAYSPYTICGCTCHRWEGKTIVVEQGERFTRQWVVVTADSRVEAQALALDMLPETWDFRQTLDTKVHFTNEGQRWEVLVVGWNRSGQ